MYRKFPDTVRLVSEYKQSNQPCNLLPPVRHSPTRIPCLARQLPGPDSTGFKFDACGEIPRVILEQVYTILGYTPTSPHDDAAKEHSPEKGGRDYSTGHRAPRVRAVPPC
jgi:hypothetical protein